MNQNIKTFENENFSVEGSDKEGCRFFVKVFVKPPLVQKTYLKAVKVVNKQISVPGFRKGHAPTQTVISRHSSYVEQEWKEMLIQEAYRSAFDLTQIYPLNRESISKPKIENYSKEEGAVVSFSYEHYPEIPPIDFSQLSIPNIETEAVSESRVEEIIEEVRRNQADWEDIQDRAVEEGDFVDISIDSLEENPPKSIVKDRRFETSDSRIAPWLKNLLIGLKIGESVDGISEVDPQAEERIKENFKSTSVRVTLHAIKKMILPALDDEVAKKVGASSVDDLRSKIHRNLEKEAEQECLQKKMDALENALVENYHFDLPSTLVESERKARLEEKLSALKEEAALSDQELQNQQPSIEKEIADQIERDLRLFFIEKQIAKQGSITLSNQELNDEVVKYISQNPYLYQKETDPSSIRDLVSRMKSALMKRKIKEYALECVLNKTAV